jgi:hypothetical protein
MGLQMIVVGLRSNAQSFGSVVGSNVKANALELTRPATTTDERQGAAHSAALADHWSDTASECYPSFESSTLATMRVTSNGSVSCPGASQSVTTLVAFSVAHAIHRLAE